MDILIGADSQLGRNFKKVLKNTIFLSKKDLNIKSSKQLQNIFKKFKPSKVYNCIGNTDTSNDIDNIKKLFTINSLELINLCKLANIYNSKVIHFSSNAVFDGSKISSYNENDIPNPDSFYGYSKLLGEKIISHKCNKFLIIRISSLYSEYKSSTKKNGSFIDQITSSLNNNAIINVNDQITNPTYTFDLVKLISKLVNKFDNEIIHCVSKNNTSWFNFAKHIQKKLNLNGKIIKVNQKNLNNKINKNLSLTSVKISKKTKYQMPNWQDQFENYLKNL